jgi:hypothetical protein
MPGRAPRVRWRGGLTVTFSSWAAKQAIVSRWRHSGNPVPAPPSTFRNTVWIRYRNRIVVIMTDMTHGDGSSLIRYLYYAPHFDTEAIIGTPRLLDHPHDATAPWLQLWSGPITLVHMSDLDQVRNGDTDRDAMKS